MPSSFIQLSTTDQWSDFQTGCGKMMNAYFYITTYFLWFCKSTPNIKLLTVGNRLCQLNKYIILLLALQVIPTGTAWVGSSPIGLYNTHGLMVQWNIYFHKILWIT